MHFLRNSLIAAGLIGYSLAHAAQPAVPATESKEAPPAIFNEKGLARYYGQEASDREFGSRYGPGKPSADTQEYKRLSDSLRTYQKPKEILKLEPVAPVFDSKSDVARHHIDQLLPRTGLLATEIQTTFGNMNGSPDRRYGGSVGVRSGEATLKLRYRLIDKIAAEMFLTHEGNIQARIPLAPLLRDALPAPLRSARTSGAIMYDISSDRPELHKRLSIGAHIQF